MTLNIVNEAEETEIAEITHQDNSDLFSFLILLQWLIYREFLLYDTGVTAQYYLGVLQHLFVTCVV